MMRKQNIEYYEKISIEHRNKEKEKENEKEKLKRKIEQNG